MDFRQLRYFAAVARLGSFTRASEKLHVAQPGLGTLVKRLEEELGGPLLIRHSRGITLTDMGQLLLERAEFVLEYLEETGRMLRSASGTPTGRVTLGVNPSTGAREAVEMINYCSPRYPDIRINVVEAMGRDIEDKLRAGELDLGIYYYFDTHPHGLDATEIRKEHALFVHSLDGPGEETIRLGDAMAYPLALASKPHGLRTELLMRAEQIDGRLDVRFEVDSVSTMLELAESGLACTILPQGAVEKRLAAGRLRKCRIVDPPIVMSLAIVNRISPQLTPAAATVRKALLQFFAGG